MANLQNTIDELGREWAEFKAANDAAITEKLRKGTEDFVTADKVERLNKSIGDTLDKIKALEAAAEQDRKAREALEVAVQRGDYGAAGDSGREEKAAYLNRRIKSLNKAAAMVDAEALDHYKSGLEKYLRKDEHLHSLSDGERKALTVGKNPDGGFVVTASTDADIVRFIHESSNMRQAANVKSISSDAYEGRRRLGKAASGWVGETGQRTETAAHDYGTYRVPAHELYAWPEISQKLLEDADVDVEAELRDEVAGEFARKEETAFFVGTGVNQPRGFLTYAAGTPSTSAFEVIERFSTGANGAFASTGPGDIFHTVVGAIKQPLLPGSRFMMNRATLAAVRKLKDGDGTYLWEKSFQTSQPFTLLGFPVSLAEDMPAIATGSNSIAFGNFQQGYVIVDRLGISVQVDPFTSNTGFVKYKTRKRVGGDVRNFEAIKLITFAA